MRLRSQYHGTNLNITGKDFKMNSIKSTARAAVFAALLSSAGLLYSAPSLAATTYRSFYQNSGGNCHGITNTHDNRLRRYEQSLRNTSGTNATVVCNLGSDWLAQGLPDQSGGPIDGQVEYVVIWAKNLSAGTPRAMTCTMNDGYVEEPGSSSYTVNIPTLATGTAQSPIEWIPSAGKRFLAPINITCVLPPNTELNDWFVVYEVDVGN